MDDLAFMTIADASHMIEHLRNAPKEIVEGYYFIRIRPDVRNRTIELLKELKKREERDIAKEPIKDSTPRCGMGYEYFDWLCPLCKKFVAYEPDINRIPNRCQQCGQLLKIPSE